MSKSPHLQSNLENERPGELSCEVGINELAKETLGLILSHLPAKQIINNRRVCTKWMKVVDGKSLWFDKFKHDFKELPQSVKALRLMDIRKVFIRNMIDRNLLPWIGPVPNYSDPSWDRHEKSGCVGVVIDLWEKGISKEFMDTVKPWISFSGYYAVHSPEGFMTIQIKLIRNVDLFWICKKSSLDAFHPMIPSVTKESHVWEMPSTNGKFCKTGCTIKDYPDDIRYVYIYIKGSPDHFRTTSIFLRNLVVVNPRLKLSIPKET